MHGTAFFSTIYHYLLSESLEVMDKALEQSGRTGKHHDAVEAVYYYDRRIMRIPWLKHGMLKFWMTTMIPTEDDIRSRHAHAT